MDVESTPPQNAAHPLTNSTLPTTDVPPSPPDTISDMRKTMMVGDTRAQADTPSMDVDSDQAAAGYSAAGQPTVSTPPPSQISLRLRHPGLHPDTGGGESSGPSRASTPGTGSAAKRRKGPHMLASGALSPSRADSPSVPGRSSEGAPSPAPSGPDTTGALSIFAPPASSTLPEALQSVIDTSKDTAATAGPSTSNGNGNASTPIANGSGRELRVRLNVTQDGNGVDGPNLVKEAADGPASTRLRPTRGRDSLQRTGVSASGKGVKVGGGVRVTNVTPKTAVSSATRKQPKVTEPQPNQDFCSACRGIGKFLCCDGCPRSFHFMCLEPPLRVDELPEEDDWYCRKCKSERKPPKRSPQPASDKELKPVPMVFKQLIKEIESKNPEQFRLPEHVRNFFTGVGTGLRGEYMDADESRTKYDRKGFQEERDSHRLRDGKSKVVACYACGGSSIPLRSLTTDPGSTWRPIVSCDYCSLSWHLDCLNPPMPSMPNAGRKWMCPNHAEQVMRRRRTVREKMQIVDISSEGASNNGNIIVLPDEPVRPIMQFEDLIINRKKFRVPEKIIKLDFWSKLGYAGKKRKRASSETSSLTSLGDSSADDEATPPPKPVLPIRPVYRTATREDLDAANLVLALTSNGLPPNPLTQPPLHTDPVNPNTSSQLPPANSPATARTANRRQSAARANGGSHAAPATPLLSVKDEPLNLAAMDVDDDETGLVEIGQEADAPRKITLKFKTAG